MFVPRAKPTAVFIGTLFSGATAALISYSHELFSATISFLWIIPGSFIAGVTVCWLLSVFFFHNEKTRPL